MPSFFITDASRKRLKGRKREFKPKSKVSSNQESISKRRKKDDFEEISSDSDAEKPESEEEIFAEDSNQTAHRKAAELLRRLCPQKSKDAEDEEIERAAFGEIKYTRTPSTASYSKTLGTSFSPLASSVSAASSRTLVGALSKKTSLGGTPTASRRSTAASGKTNPKRMRGNSNAEEKEESGEGAEEQQAEGQEHHNAESRDLYAVEEEEQAEGEEEPVQRDQEAEAALSVKVATILRDHAAAKAGRLHRKVAEALEFVEEGEKRHRGHRFSVLSVALSPCGKYALSSGKESTIVKYDIQEGKVIGVIGRKDEQGSTEGRHTGHIYAVAVSPDSKYIVSGGHDAVIRVWDFFSLKLVKEMKGHQSAISALVFRINTAQLFSASYDRTVRLWDCEQLGFVDTMFGHQDKILSLSALSRERVISAGGQDRTLRLWKVEEESQLVFNGSVNCISIECIAMINEDHFVSGSSDGSLSLWSVLKKRATCTVPAAHGQHSSGENRWIVSLVTVPYTDVLFSGSSDGELRAWRVAEDYKSLEEFATYSVAGFINSMAFSPESRLLALGVGQEHRMGRWWKENEGRNGVVCIPIKGLEGIPANFLASIDGEMED